MSWNIPKIWHGSDCWIIGGGSSIATQFEIPTNVIERNDISELSPYLRDIHNKHVIGVNVAFMLGNWVDILFYGDDQFLEKHQNKINGFNGLKVSCAIEKHKTPNSIRWIERDEKHESGISDVANLVRWNKNSGGAAISLAVHLGAKRIFLLGFDMKNNNDMSHFHNVYGKTKPPFDTHLKGFEQIAKDAEFLGIDIINCSPESIITQFNKITVKEALKL